MDKIVIDNLSCFGILGINPQERLNKQNIIINAVIETDIEEAAGSGDIADAVNYSELASRIKQFTETCEAFLIETLVSDLAELILVENHRVISATVKVTKPDAIDFCDSVGIEITRGR